jgi:hypothetical protein
VRQIHANCKQLLRTHHQRAGGFPLAGWNAGGWAVCCSSPASAAPALLAVASCSNPPASPAPPFLPSFAPSREAGRNDNSGFLCFLQAWSSWTPWAGCRKLRMSGCAGGGRRSVDATAAGACFSRCAVPSVAFPCPGCRAVPVVGWQAVWAMQKRGRGVHSAPPVSWMWTSEGKKGPRPPLALSMPAGGCSTSAAA